MIYYSYYHKTYLRRARREVTAAARSSGRQLRESITHYFTQMPQHGTKQYCLYYWYYITSSIKYINRFKSDKGNFIATYKRDDLEYLIGNNDLIGQVSYVGARLLSLINVKV